MHTLSPFSRFRNITIFWYSLWAIIKELVFLYLAQQKESRKWNVQENLWSLKVRPPFHLPNTNGSLDRF
ncbi:MAG: hypothetical protein EBT57_06420 [Verrucomicrobia bacterium]|nr:hypothetical protein [Verrucomicrobiota bacterium]